MDAAEECPWACASISTRLLPEAPARATLPLKRVSDKGVRVVADGCWPESTATLCWHCCHPFEGPPLPMPFKYDDKLGVFDVTGTFCSWACMKTYNLDSRSYKGDVNNATIITLFHKKCTGASQAVGIRGAPPRLALRAFGGTMTIEEFRTTDKVLDILPPRMILHRPVVEEIPQRLRKPPGPELLQDSVSFEGATAQNDTLRLRRPTPLASHNRLVRALGVQVHIQKAD